MSQARNPLVITNLCDEIKLVRTPLVHLTDRIPYVMNHNCILIKMTIRMEIKIVDVKNFTELKPPVSG